MYKPSLSGRVVGSECDLNVLFHLVFFSQYPISFLEVFKGVYGGQEVAIKKLKDDSETAQAFLSEASVMT